MWLIINMKYKSVWHHWDVFSTSGCFTVSILNTSAHIVYACSIDIVKARFLLSLELHLHLHSCAAGPDWMGLMRSFRRVSGHFFTLQTSPLALIFPVWWGKRCVGRWKPCRALHAVCTCVGVTFAPLSVGSFVFLQLYHSPFFGNEANKPLLLPKSQVRRLPLLELGKYCMYITWNFTPNQKKIPIYINTFYYFNILSLCYY